MKGVTIAQSITSGNDDMYLQLTELQAKYKDLLAEIESLRVENDILKIIVGE